MSCALSIFIFRLVITILAEFEIAVGGLLNATIGNATELYTNPCTEKQTDTCCSAVIIGLNSVKLVACAWMCILLWWSFLSKGAAV